MFDVISQRVFPAIKEMKGGKLPDFDNLRQNKLLAVIQSVRNNALVV